MLRGALYQAILALVAIEQAPLVVHFARTGEPVWLSLSTATALYSAVELALSIRRDGLFGRRP